MEHKMNIFKTCIITLMLTVLLAWTTGCKKSADQKLADAELNRTAAEQNVEDAANNATAVNEWQAFKTEQEAKIAANDKIIADYKVKMTNSKGKLLATYDKKVDALETKNKELMTKLNEYKDEGKDAWEKFKSEFSRDTDELGSALKNFTVDNKK